MSERPDGTLELGHCGADVAHGHRCIRDETPGIASRDFRKLFVGGLRDRQSFGRLEGIDAAHVLQPQDLRVDAGGREHLDAPCDIRLVRADTARGARPRPDHLSVGGPFYARVITAATQMIEKGLRLEVGVKVYDHDKLRPPASSIWNVVPRETC